MEGTLEARIARLESRTELENLVGTYLHLRLAGQGEKIVNELWVDSREATIEIGASGQYIETERVATFYQKDLLPGRFTLIYAIAPVIEVAEDGQSARGIWLGLGTETDAGEQNPDYRSEDPEREELFSSVTKDGKRYTAEWVFQKLAFDFVRTADGWRILHLHVYEITRCPFDRDWVTYAQERFPTDGLRLDAMFKSNLPFAEDKPPENLAAEPTAYHWQYTVDGVTELMPEPPKPYRTLSDLPAL